MSRQNITFYDYLTKEKGVTPCTNASILSTSPDEEAYVMVLKNRIESSNETVTMTSLRKFCDTTFLVGEENIPVYGIRQIIFMRSGALQQLIETFEKSQKTTKTSLKSKVIHSVHSKLRQLSCGVVRQKAPQSVGIPMETFDVESFRRLMTYIHCGTLIVDPSTVIGLMNAANTLEFPELIQPCWEFAMGCVVRADNMNDLLVSARKYKDEDITKAFMKEMMSHKAEYPEIAEYEETLDILISDECQCLVSSKKIDNALK